MKLLFAIAALSFALPAHAATKSLLYCKNIDLDDIKTITIQKNDEIKTDGILELIEQHTHGPKKELMIAEEDFRDGYISISNLGDTDRILVRKDGKWTVAGIRGNYRFFAHTDCVAE